MTDLTLAVGNGINKKLVDMGDSTYAERVASAPYASVGGGITWGAPTAVAVGAGPASTTLKAALATRKAISIWNPIGNATMWVDIAGGVAAAATGRPLVGGASLDLEGAACPVGIITFIGTAAQSLVYQEGT